MATKRKPTKRASPEPTVSVEERLAEALAEKPKTVERQARHDAPAVGDKVSVGNSDTVYAVTRVNHTGTEVDLHLEGTNIERFRVSVDDLKFVDRRQQSNPAKPVKPRIDVDEVKERLHSAKQSALDHLDGEIAKLKKYLKGKGVRESAIGQFDDLYDAEEKRWKLAVEAIEDILDSES